MSEKDHKNPSLSVIRNEKMRKIVSGNRHALGSSNLFDDILVSGDQYVNHLWNRLKENTKQDLLAKLQGMTLESDNTSELDIDVLTELNKSYVVNGRSKEVQRPSAMAFILHDKDTRVHVAAFICNRQCVVLSIWLFNEDDDLGKAFNRKPEYQMTQIERLFEAYMD
jgi:hypothetical protein